MSDPQIHGNCQVYSASSAVAALGKALGEIKVQDGLTWADLGAVLGKSEDMAAKYADGSATMDVVAYGRGKREWGSRFTGYFDRLCEDSRPGKLSDRHAESAVLLAALRLSECLSDDGAITAAEVRLHRSTLEAARDALNAQLQKAGHPRA